MKKTKNPIGLKQTEELAYSLIADIVYKDLDAWNKANHDKSCYPCGTIDDPKWAVAKSFYIVDTEQYFEIGSWFYIQENSNGDLFALIPKK